MMLVGWLAQAGAAQPNEARRETHIRAGFGRTIVAVKGQPASSDTRAARASTDYPRPRLAGFSPLVAIATSDEGYPFGHDYEFEHELESSYVGSLLNPLADPNFVIGFLDSGADVDLAAGTYADTLGLNGDNLTENTIAIGGVGGQVDAYITIPIGFFAAGLSAIDANGDLNYGALVGHSNVCGLAAPPIDCGNGEVLSAVVGMPFLAFYNSIIWVDTPHTVSIAGVTYTGPDVQILDPANSLPIFSHKIRMTFSQLLPATTANYYPSFDDPDGPAEIPTLLSFAPGLIPFGGSFHATLYVRQGEGGNSMAMRVLVDTGAQSSIMSPGMAADLSLPLEPHFTVDVCGVGGLVEDLPGYYVDYVEMNALGGALEFSRAPFVVLDLQSFAGGALDGILGMNFFWNRNVIFEPALGGSGFLHVSDAIPVPYGDSDVDFDVDGDDTQMLVSCITGPDADTFIPGCEHLDSDTDGDVDLTDFARFQLCFSGADVTADPDCGS
jgi:hypothetical protein